MSEKAEAVSQVEAGQAFARSWRDEKWGDRKLSAAAQDTAHDEKSMTTWQAVRANPAAIAWSLVISTAVVMEGYDTNLLYVTYLRRAGFILTCPGATSGHILPSSGNMANSSECPQRPRVAIS